jgi:hypothetical protein
MNRLVPVLEGERGLKLCIHHRDFHPGRSTLDNIQACVEGSCRLLVAFSSHFAASPWCQLELSLCQRLVMERREELVVVVSTNQCELTPAMDAILRTHTYVPWPGALLSRRSVALFWDIMCRALEDVILVAQRRQQQEQQGAAAATGATTTKTTAKTTATTPTPAARRT